MKAAKPRALRHGALGLATALGLAGGPAAAQVYDDETTTLADEIPDVQIPDVQIPDVQIPDVRIGQNDAVLPEEDVPPPVAVFDEPSFGRTPPPTEEEQAAAAAAETEALAEAEEGPEGERVTGNITAIDLEGGTLELNTDTQGTMRLSADRAQLRQIAPGQSVSLSYVDRDDGRWVAELEALRMPAAPVLIEPPS